MKELTDEECNDFRRMRGTFNDMIRAVYAAGRMQGAQECCDLAKWQPIETAPKDGSRMLVYGKDFEFSAMDIAEYEEGHWIVPENGDYLCFHPTHWMPLPEPPDYH